MRTIPLILWTVVLAGAYPASANAQSPGSGTPATSQSECREDAGRFVDCSPAAAAAAYAEQKKRIVEQAVADFKAQHPKATEAQLKIIRRQTLEQYEDSQALRR